MSKIKSNSQASVEFNVRFTLTLGQAKALEAIAGYGADPFLKVFYEHMGKAYLQPHEAEMRRLFSQIKDELPREISKIETATKVINEALKDF